MQQQINLYRHLPKKITLPISNEILMVLYGLFVFLLVVHSSYLFWQKHKEEAELQVMESQLQKANVKFQNLVSMYPNLNLKDLETSLQQVQNQLSAKTKIVQLLSNGGSFSSALKAIARASVQGMWLYEIIIMDFSNTVRLKGFAQQSSNIEEFIQNLARQPSFASTSFDLSEATKVVIKQNNSSNEYINFEINSKMVGPK